MNRLPGAQWGARVLLAGAAASLVGTCGGDESTDVATKSTPVVEVDPETLENPVTYELWPNRSVEIGSVDDAGALDGELTVRANSGAVVRRTVLTIARVTDAHRPVGVIGDAFLLSPEVTDLEMPIRLRIDLLDREVDDASVLRLARLDTGGRYYSPTAGQAIVQQDDLFLIAGEITTFGMFAVVDTRRVEIRDDVVSTPLWQALHLLDLGEVNAAKTHFERAHAASPEEPKAAFGYALTRLLTLPALQEVDELLRACGEPAWEVAEIFGVGGVLDRELKRGKGSSNLAVSTGFDSLNLVTHDLNPSRVAGSFAEAVCLDEQTGDVLPDSHLYVEIEDPDFGGTETRLVMQLSLNQNQPRTDTSQTLEALLHADPEARVSIPVEKLNGQLEAERGGVSFRPSSTSPGVLQISSSPETPGDILILDFVSVLLEPQTLGSKPEVLVVNGHAEPPITESNLGDDLPLANDESVAEMLAACSRDEIPLMDEAYLRVAAGAVVDEMLAIADLLASAGARADFRFDVSLGLFAAVGRIPVGAAESNLMAAALYSLAGAFGLLDGYRIFENDVRDVVTEITSEVNTDCNPCTGDCRQESRLQKVFAARALEQALNPVFLTREGGGDSSEAKQRLEKAIAATEAALRATATDTVFVFAKVDVAELSAALKEILSVLKAALDASSHLDGARLTMEDDECPAEEDCATNGFFLFLSDLFASPPDAADLRMEGGAAADAPAWLVEVEDEVACPPVCTDETQLSVVPADWLTSIIGMVMTPDSDIECTSVSECGTQAGVACDGTCSFPELRPHPSVFVNELTKDGEPPFLNRRAVAELEALF